LKLERDEDELTSREVFELRSKIVAEMRRILEDHGYIEVETPMLTPLATGAAARPFKTHHNALDIDLYARIAPELYLKRLLVGGFEKVYELNRNFRNEGVSTRHNPEFTMLEFYWAYADVNQMMDFCESMLRAVVFKALAHTHVKFGEYDIDFAQPFERLTMKEAIVKFLPENIGWFFNRQTVVLERLADDHEYFYKLHNFLFWLNEPFPHLSRQEALRQPRSNDDLVGAWVKAVNTGNSEMQIIQSLSGRTLEANTALYIQEIFEHSAEESLTQPTFITDFPKPISPLSKASPADPTVAERFELYIAGMECANGFSELNDPVEQYERFKDQMQQRERGDEEAMVMDEDYIRALSYGMPPAAGIGIGIDRFVMLVTNRQSIRDVILFPHLRPERKNTEPAPIEE